MLKCMANPSIKSFGKKDCKNVAQPIVPDDSLHSLRRIYVFLELWLHSRGISDFS